MTFVYGAILGTVEQPDDMVGMRPFALAIVLKNPLLHVCTSREETLLT